MNLLERLKMRLERRAQKRFRKQTNGNGVIFFGDIIHKEDHSILYRRFALIQQLMPLLIDEIKCLFRKRYQVTLTDAIRSWNKFLMDEEMSHLLFFGGIINSMKNPAYRASLLSLPINLKQEER